MSTMSTTTTGWMANDDDDDDDDVLVVVNDLVRGDTDGGSSDALRRGQG